MPAPLPPEILQEIFLPFQSSNPIRDGQLHNFALVCRAWTSPARSLTFHRLSLSNVERADAFIQLLSHSHQTISREIRDLAVMEGKALECLTRAHQHLEPDVLIPNLQKLLLHRMEWQLLPLNSREILCSSTIFGFITSLEISRSTFDEYADYWMFLHSFPKVDTLHIKDTSLPFDQLAELVLPKVVPLRLRVLKWTLLYGISESDSEKRWLDNIPLALNSLLWNSGTDLAEFWLSIDERSVSKEQQSRIQRILTDLDLSQNTEIRMISLTTKVGNAIPSPDFLSEFLFKLTQIPYQSSSSLKFLEFKIHDEESGLTANLEAIDDTLQHDFFSSLNEVVFGTFHCSFHVSEFHRYTAINWNDPGDTGFWEIDELKQRLSGCNRREILRLLMSPAFYYEHDEEESESESGSDNISYYSWSSETT